MHPDLSAHLHTAECNAIIKLLQECHVEKRIGKFFGACNSLDSEVNRCLKKERLAKRQKSMEDGERRRAKMKSQE